MLIFRWMVTPHARRSFTLSTLDTTSLAMSSNTRTFHIGSPVSERIGALEALFASSASEARVGAFRFRMRWMETARWYVSFVLLSRSAHGRGLTYLPVPQRSHDSLDVGWRPAGVQVTSYAGGCDAGAGTVCRRKWRRKRGSARMVLPGRHAAQQ